MVIENKELGLKLAENKEEAFWRESKDRCEKAIDLAKKDIIINEHLIKLCEDKLKCLTK